MKNINTMFVNFTYSGAKSLVNDRGGYSQKNVSSLSDFGLSLFSAPMLASGQLRRIWKYAAMVFLFFMIGVGNVWGIDWSDYSYLGDGAGGGAYSNKYKVANAAGQGVVNIQHPAFATADGIYTTFSAAITYCSLGPCNYDVQGTGAILHLDAFTAKETEVTIISNNTYYVFTVYYEDGETGGDSKVLSFIYTTTGYNEGSETKYYCNGGKADKDKYIYDGDFNWNQTKDNVVTTTISGQTWTGIDQTQACTRNDVSFSAGKYILKLLTYRTNHSATMTLPSISIDGGSAITAKEARWNCGVSTETIVSNQFNYTNDNSKGAFQTEVELVYETTIASAGSYGISISFPSGYDRAKDLIKTLTIAKDLSCTAPNHVDISGNYHFFPGETISLTATAYSSAGTESPIDDEDITGYQWQKNIAGEYTNIEGATSATYTKANATTSDVGQYKCIVSTGATCSTQSGVFDVKCLQLFLYYDNKSDKYNLPFTKVDDTHATASVLLDNSSYTYYYKITDGCNDWWGNNGTMNSGNCTGWSLNVNNHCGLTTTKSATYQFNLTYNAALNSFSMSVVYPSTVQTGGYNIYFDNSFTNWTTSQIYYRIGRSNYNSKAQMTLVPGTAHLYTTTTIYYENDGGFEAWHIANNGCWSGGNSIYKTNTGDTWAATQAMRFEGSPVSSSGITIVPVDEHWTGTGDASNCEFYSYGSSSGLLTHTATISDISNGSVRLNWTDIDDEAQNATTTTSGLAHTCNLQVTALPATGYETATLTVNGSNFTSGNMHVLSADASIAATFSPKSCTVNFDKEGGGNGSNSVTATYDAAMPDIIAPTKTGYTFGGYWDGDNGTGTQYYNADGTSARTWDKNTTSATYLYAKWTPKTTTISFDQNSGSGGQTSSLTATYGSAMPTPITAPTRTGYDFDGYCDGVGGAGTKYYNNDGTSARNWDKEDATWTLSAKWTAKSYTVTLNTNSGTINAGNVTSYTYGVGATLPTNVTRDGYRFMGWYAASNFSGERVYSIANDATGNKEYWAKWAQLYTITNGNPSNGTITVNSTAIEGETVSILATPSSGYAFDEWSIYKTGDASTTISTASVAAATSFTMPAYGVTVTATFEETTCTNNKVIQCEDSNVGASITIINSGEAHPTPASATVSTDGDYNGSGYLKMGSGSSDVGDAFFPFSVSQDNTVVTITVRYKEANANVYASIFEKVDAATGHIQYKGEYYNKASFEHLGGSENWTWYDSFTNYAFNRTLYNKDYILVICDSKDGKVCLDQITLAAGAGNDVFCEASTYDVTITGSPAAGQASATGAGSYEEGETVTINATPNRGYSFNTWSADPSVSFSSAATTASNSFSMPAANVALTASYNTLTSRTVTVNRNNNSYGSASADLNPAYVGETITLTATPNTGYRFVNWTTSDGVSFASSTSASTTFTMLDKNVTVQANFDKIRIATGDANLGSHDGYAGNNASMSVANVVDPASKFDHKVLQITYTMNSADNESSYYGMSLPVDAGYSTSIASGKTGMGFWYRTASTTDQVLMYFCISSTSDQFEVLLPATNGVWQYWYIETDKVDDNTTFGFYINGTKNGKSSGVIGSAANVWLSEVEPVTMYSVTVNRNNDSYGTASADKEMYQPGETVTLTATPTNSNYAFLNWTTSDGVSFGDANSASTTFTMPAYDVTVTANFTEIVVNAVPSGYDDCQIMAVHTSGDEYSPTGISNAGWDGTSATFTAYTDGSDKKACKINSGSTYYYGINIGNSGAVNRDVSGYTKLHIEFWSAEAQTFNFHLLAHNDNGTNQDGSAQSVSTTAGTWVVKDYDLSSVGITGTNLERIYGFKVDYTSGSGKELLIANVYFYKADAPCTVHANRTDLLDCQMKAIFGVSSYTNAGVTTIEWDESLNVADNTQSIDGKNVLHITFAAAHKTMLKFTQLDLTAGNFTHVHFDVWSPVSRDFASSILCNEDGYKGESVSHVESLTAMQWKSVDFALSSLDGMSSYYDHAEALIINMGVGTTALTSDLYITNFYFYNEDNTKPVVVSATNSGVSGTDLTLTLTATYKGNAINTFHITNTTTGDEYDRTADGSNHVTIPNIKYCESYDLEIQAIYNSCILSDATEMTVSGNALSAGTALIATDATISADATALPAAEAIDNNTASRWASGASATDVPHYILVDLGTIRNVSSMKIGWEYSNPSDYYIEGSVDGTNYYPLKHETTVPPNGSAEGAAFNDYDTYTFAASVGVQYLKVRSVTNKSGYGMSIWEMQAYGQCYSASDNPVTTYAQVASQAANGTNTAVNVTLDLGAYDYSTTYDNMRWKISYAEEGESATVLDNQTATSGQFALNSLKFSTTYTVSVWARDGVDGNLGNEIHFNFTTPDKQSTLFLRNSMNWQDGGLSTDYRFSYVSPGGDVMQFAITPNSNELQYRPYDDANNDLLPDGVTTPDADAGGGFCIAFNQYINDQSGNEVTFYAKDKDHFVSNADLVYVVGSSVKANEANAIQMHQSGTTYYWEGPVTVGNKYKIIVKAQESNNIAAASFTDHSCSRIMADSVTFTNSEGYRYAKLTFDMATWEYEWSAADTYIFDNNAGSGDGKWSTESNWMNNALPTIDKDVILRAEVEVDITDARAKSVVIDQNGSNEGQLVLAAGKELVVATTVRKTTDGETYGATDENDIVFNSDALNGLGALVMGTHDGTNKATVNFYTLSHGSKGSSASVNQYVGTPFNDETNILYNWYNSWVYGITYDGSNNIGWTRVNSGQGMDPFKGYTVISADPAGHSYWQQGTLVATTNHTCSSLNYQDGDATNPNNENLLANSWMAPIKIHEFDAENDFTNTDATIYIFNSTSPDGYKSGGFASNYVTYPVNTATDDEDVIPAMQSFSVFTNKTGGSSVKLNYKRLVYDPAIATGDDHATIIPNKAPQRRTSAEEANKLRLYVQTESGYGDMVYMWEHPNFAEGFENGWDGRKVFGEPVAPQLYAVTPDGNMAVNCVPDFEGTLLGFQAGTSANSYTFTFEYSDEAEELYLRDMDNNTYTRVLTGNSYPFTTSDRDVHNRFILTKNAPQSPTDITETGDKLPVTGVRKVIINDHVYVIRGGKMFSVDGQLVK